MVCIVAACLRGPSYTLVGVVYMWAACIVVACLLGPSYTLVGVAYMWVVCIRTASVPVPCRLAALVCMIASAVYN